MTKAYSASFRAKMVQRMVGPKAVSATHLAHEVGIHQSTLSRWLRDAHIPAMGTSTPNAPNPPAVPATKAPQDKIRIVLAAEGLPPEELGALLRREGVHEAELEAWRTTVKTAALAALQGAAPGATSARSAERRRIQELERELKRKDKALAEAAALLVLQKKVQSIWGDGDDGTDETNDR